MNTKNKINPKSYDPIITSYVVLCIDSRRAVDRPRSARLT